MINLILAIDDLLIHVLLFIWSLRIWLRKLKSLFCIFVYSNRGLLDDSNFHDAVKKVINDDIPYYAQIGERPAVAPPIEMRAGPSGKTKSVQEESPREEMSRVSSATLPVSPEATPPSSAGSKKSLKSEKKVSGMSCLHNFFCGLVSLLFFDGFIFGRHQSYNLCLYWLFFTYNWTMLIVISIYEQLY